MAQIAMVIDLQKCTSCGSCALACKTENNTRNSTNKATFNWADFITSTRGEFPESKFISMPVLCNHCSEAPCVEICPVTPKAMFKTASGVTMHNDARCIGCQLCMDACPYSSRDISTDGSLYSVISFNPFSESTNPFYDDATSILPGSSSPAEIVTLTGTPPDRNEYSHADFNDVRPAGVTEKCIFCDHRLLNGDQPYCVDSCPANARIFGDIDDPNSEVSQLLLNHEYFRLANNKGEILGPDEQGTSPNVYYIRNFEDVNTSAKEVPKPAEWDDFTKLFPNPASGHTSLEVDVKSPDYLNCVIYNVAGQLLMTPVNNEFMMAGVNTIDINLGNLDSGTYLIQITLGKMRGSKRLIVQN